MSSAAPTACSATTRGFSRFRLLIGDRRPSRLSFALSQDGTVFTFHGANLALPPVGGKATPRGVIHLERKRCLFQARLFERLRLTNYGLDEVMAPIAFEYAADFRDMFEVRGLPRPARGSVAEPRLDGRSVRFAYHGLDDVERRSIVAFSEPPWRLTAQRGDFMFTLEPGQCVDLYVEVGSDEAEPPAKDRFNRAVAAARRSVREVKDRGAALPRLTAPSRPGSSSPGRTWRC